MPTTLALKAVEESTYVVNAAFTDEDGDPVTPNDVAWSLYDRDGTVINSRSGVSLTPDTAVDIVLQGDDLQITGTEDDGVRKLTLVGTYDSSLGSSLPLTDEVTFTVGDLVGVS